MRRPEFFLIYLLLAILQASNVFAQKIEILYTKTSTKVALGYKKSLTVDKISNFNALALRNISVARKNAYLKKIADVNTVIILGETGLKATSLIDFPMPVLIIDGLDQTAAKGPVFRILNSDFDPPGSITGLLNVSDPEKMTIPESSFKDGAETIIKCIGISDDQVINKLLPEIIKNTNK